MPMYIMPARLLHLSSSRFFLCSQTEQTEVRALSMTSKLGRVTSFLYLIPPSPNNYPYWTTASSTFHSRKNFKSSGRGDAAGMTLFRRLEFCLNPIMHIYYFAYIFPYNDFHSTLHFGNESLGQEYDVAASTIFIFLPAVLVSTHF